MKKKRTYKRCRICRTRLDDYGAGHNTCGCCIDEGHKCLCGEKGGVNA